ncbi:DNA polymerase IV [Niameybacter massiliensis]|uniref:DNA polymerase IV n=1 Tax=Holtiella tumoricola TaxID=3018743 RepID=A0AA42DS39_9FIRM|nr:DNA polymerase IV [Holtiella tumoricola]MDA3733957.1 DNA polymerase IV [Holtiella tumoricola]
MVERIIFHIDVNSAFLSWEAAYRVQVLGDCVDLRTLPSAVGGDREQRKGVILAKSIAAKAYGVQTGEPITSALMKCPDLVIVKPNHELYEACSREFITLLRTYTPVVEQYSIDEAFMDMTGTEGLYGSPLSIAQVIKDRIEQELGFTVNIGISSNKLLAKMASDFKKPNLIHTLFPYEIEDKMWPMPVRELFFVGRAAEEKLKRLGIRTIGDLAKADMKMLRTYLGKQGEVIYHYANGIDSLEVATKKIPNKGYGNATTIPYDVSCKEDAQKILLSLCETVGMRLRKDGARASCIAVSMVDTFFERRSHQMMLISPTDVTHQLYTCVCKLLRESWDYKMPIRQLGVHTSHITYEKEEQCTLFDTPETTKYGRLDQAVDQIRQKFGEDAIMRSTFVGSKLDHMAGGIAKEKKTGITHCEVTEE